MKLREIIAWGLVITMICGFYIIARRDNNILSSLHEYQMDVSQLSGTNILIYTVYDGKKCVGISDSAHINALIASDNQ